MGALADKAIAGLGTTEDAWLSWLAAQKLRSASVDDLLGDSRRLVMVAPHPDDEVLAIGGLLAQLSNLCGDVLIVAVTDGEGSHADSPQWPRTRLAAERPLESAEAWRRLGFGQATCERLGLPDGAVRMHRDTLVERLAGLLRPTDVVFTTWRHDGHPDHEATGRACAVACAQVGSTLVEVPVWAWHWAEPGDSRLPWHRAVKLPLDAPSAARKRHAVGAFTSQLAGDASTGAGPILRSTTVQRAYRPFEIFFA
jgi:LmbE family N-acetylglucosaminyl deacetylase